MKRRILLVLCLSLFLIGCGPIMVSLSKGLPERFFTDSNIDFDESKNISYTFESKLDDPFPLHGRGRMDLNPSFESVLKYYMHSKYSPVGSSGGDYHVEVILLSCKFEAEHAGKESAHGGGTTVSVYNMKVRPEINVKVRVTIDGKVSERDIMAMAEYTGNQSDIGTISRAFDLAIRAAISRIDRFLNSTIGASSSPAGGGVESFDEPVETEEDI